jgi:flagellar protein FliO/FliZ
MFETLFGAEIPLALRFFIAFVVVLALIGATAYVVRRFGGDRLGAASSRGRQPRLAVVDAASVDGRRRLILIRRDNVEHLLMIGGPTDVVVEPNIVRAAAAPREAVPMRPQVAPETLPRPVPLGEGNMWPLQPHPEPAAPAPPAPLARPQRPALPEETAPWPVESDSPLPSPRHARPADPLAGLAFELGRGPTQPETNAPPPRPTRPTLPERAPPRDRQRFEPRAEPRPEPILEPRPDPRPEPATEQPFAAAAEQNLAEMAHRLEAALRRPARPKEPRAPDPEAPPEVSASPEQPEPKPSQSEPRPAAAEQKPTPPKSVYDSLEQEMASLLGRPPDKP